MDTTKTTTRTNSYARRNEVVTVTYIPDTGNAGAEAGGRGGWKITMPNPYETDPEYAITTLMSTDQNNAVTRAALALCVVTFAEAREAEVEILSPKRGEALSMQAHIYAACKKLNCRVMEPSKKEVAA